MEDYDRPANVALFLASLITLAITFGTVAAATLLLLGRIIHGGY